MKKKNKSHLIFFGVLIFCTIIALIVMSGQSKADAPIVKIKADDKDGGGPVVLTSPIVFEEGSNITFAIVAGTLTVSATGAGGSLTYWVESDNGDTSVFAAIAPNTTVGLNDQLTMLGNNITNVNILYADYLAKEGGGNLAVSNNLSMTVNDILNAGAITGAGNADDIISGFDEVEADTGSFAKVITDSMQTKLIVPAAGVNCIIGRSGDRVDTIYTGYADAQKVSTITIQASEPTGLIIVRDTITFAGDSGGVIWGATEIETDTLTVNSIPITDIEGTRLTVTAGVLAVDFTGALLTNADIDAAAAIAWSKINSTDQIVNADVNSAAAIASSKLATNVMTEGENVTLLNAPNNWRLFYSDGSGDIQEVELGTNTEVLTSNGASVAPSFQSVPAGILEEADKTNDTVRWIAPNGDTCWVMISDGAGNVTMTVGRESDHTTQTMVLDGGGDQIHFVNDTLVIGDTTDATDDIVIYLATSNDSGGFRYNVTVDSVQVSHDGGVSWLNLGEGGGGNAKITDSSITLLNATAWRMFYSNATTTAIQELAFGASGFLKTNGAEANPTWETIDLTADVAATILPIVNGGSGSSTDPDPTFNDGDADTLGDGSGTDQTYTLIINPDAGSDGIIEFHGNGDSIQFNNPIVISANVITSGLISTAVGIDGVGAVDMDYGSADVTDHTFISDGGTVVIDGSITGVDSLDIDSGVVISDKLTYDEAEWLGGVVTYVPVGGDIQTYVTAADSGATLILASGTYTITSTITLGKPINIVGQGNAGFLTAPIIDPHGTLIKSTTASVVAFQVDASNIRLADMSINLTGAGSKGVNTANNLTGLVFYNIDVIVNSTGWCQGFTILGSNTVMRDLTFYITSSDFATTGVYFYNNASTTQDAIMDCFNVTGTVHAYDTYGWAFYCHNSDANTLTMNLSNSVCKALAGGGVGTDIAVVSSGSSNSSIVNAYFCTLEGADNDVLQDNSNELNLGGSVLANNTTSGTVTYRTSMAASGGTFDSLMAGSLGVEDIHAESLWVTTDVDVTGNIAVGGTVDGVDIAARDAIVDSIGLWGNAGKATDSVEEWDNRGYPDATTASEGIASFEATNFAVGAGAVSIKSEGIDSDEIANGTIVGDDVDSTAENFTFDGAYHVNSNEADSAYVTANTINDTADVIRGEITDSLAADAIDNPTFSGGAAFYGPVRKYNINPVTIDIDRAYMAPPDYWIGDTANFPGNDTIPPWRVRVGADTNFVKGVGATKVLYADSVPVDWGGGPCDSVREHVYSATQAEFDSLADSAIFIHNSVIWSSDGWPKLTDSVTLYIDDGKKGYDSIDICTPDGNDACDSTRNQWVNPQNLWFVATPLDASAMTTDIENPVILASTDDVNINNQIGPATADTIINPVYDVFDFILDTIWWYVVDPDGAGPADTNVVATDYALDEPWTDSVWTKSYAVVASHLQDPDIFFGENGDIWLMIGATFTFAYTAAPDTVFGARSMSKMYVAHSTNGLDWSDLYPATHLDYYNSPAVVLDTSGTYNMWLSSLNGLSGDSIRGNKAAGRLWRFAADSPNTIWDSMGICEFSNHVMPDTCDSTVLWHHEVVERGPNELILLYSGGGISYGCAMNGNYVFGLGHSTDGGINWTIREKPIYTTGNSGTNDAGDPMYDRTGKWDTATYRPSGYWLNDDMTVMRVWYTGKAGYSSSKWHTSFFNLYFEGNDSTMHVPLWNIPGYASAPNNTTLFFDQVRSHGRYLFIDSSEAANAYDTVWMTGLIQQDFQCDSAIIEFKTSSADADSIILDSIKCLIPKVGKFYADSVHADSTGLPSDSVSTSIVRVAVPFDHKFYSGEEAGIKLFINIPNASELFYCTYAALKGRKQ